MGATGTTGTTGATGTGATTAPAMSMSKSVGEVTFVNWDPIEGTPLEEVINLYQQKTGNKVNVQPTPGRGTEYETKIRVTLAGGTVPDIMRINDDFVRYYTAKNQILDLNPFIKRDAVNMDDYYPAIMDFAKQPNGQYTTWSLGNQPRMLFYNKNLFQQAGVPLPPSEWTDANWKWDNFIETAKKLTVKDKQWGALVFDDTGCEQTFTVNNGDEDGLYAKDGRTFALATPKGAEAIQWLADLTTKHGVQPEYGLVKQPDSGNNLFAAGKIGMVFRTTGTTSYFRRNVKDFDWDVAPVPGNVSQRQEGSLICFSITKGAKNPEGAWELLKFMGGPEASKLFADRNYFVPSYKKSAETIKGGEQPPKNAILFSKAMPFQTTVNFTENTERARNIYRQEFELVYSGQSKAAESLNRVKKDVEDALKGVI